MKRIRLDVLLCQKKVVETRSQAQRLIQTGSVLVNGKILEKPGIMVNQNAAIDVDTALKYISRGGEKLAAALKAFDLIKLTGKICADVGSSTGGFTDCLIQHGAEKVYAIDVGVDIMHPDLRNNLRVLLLENTNARYLKTLPDPIDLTTVDVSFISLRLLLPVIKGWLRPGGDIIALVKPQFEAGKVTVAAGKGIIRNREVHRSILISLLNFVNVEKLGIQGLMSSPILGSKGNKEFLLYVTYPGAGGQDFQALVDAVI